MLTRRITLRWTDYSDKTRGQGRCFADICSGKVEQKLEGNSMNTKVSYECTVCNNIVSNDAARCPKCGRKNPVHQDKIRKILKLLVICAGIIGLFVYVSNDIKSNNIKSFRDTMSSNDPVMYGNACVTLDDINMLRALNREIYKLESNDKNMEEKILVAQFYCKQALERAVRKQNSE